MASKTSSASKPPVKPVECPECEYPCVPGTRCTVCDLPIAAKSTKLIISKASNASDSSSDLTALLAGAAAPSPTSVDRYTHEAALAAKKMVAAPNAPSAANDDDAECDEATMGVSRDVFEQQQREKDNKKNDEAEAALSSSSAPLASLLLECTELRSKLKFLDKIIALARSSAEHLDYLTQVESSTTSNERLTSNEIFALCLYTVDIPSAEYDIESDGNQNFYYALNRDYFRADRYSQLVAAFEPYVAVFQSAWKKLVPQDGTVYRGIQLDDERIEEVEKEYCPGRIIKWTAVTSVSRDIKVATFFGASQSSGRTGRGVVFQIKAVDVRSVAAFSPFPCEDELLLEPGAQLVVVAKPQSFTDQSSNIKTVFLQQLNSQHKTWTY